MADIGTPDTKRVNSRATKLFVRPSSTDIEYLQLQDKSFQPDHPILVEPTTSAGVAAYTGALTGGTFTGTILFTSDMADAVGGFKELATVNSSTFQRPIETWKLKITDFASSQEVWSFTAMLESFNLNGPAEGGTKYDIVLRVLSFNPTSDIT